MITDEYELKDKLEDLRRDTLPEIWEKIIGSDLDLVDRLECTLYDIQDSGNRSLQRRAIEVLESILDFDVDVEPTVTVNF